MKACLHPRDPRALTLGDLPDPRPAGQAVVRVEAVALSFFDPLIIAGPYQYNPASLSLPGCGFAGTIEGAARGSRLATPHRVSATRFGARAREIPSPPTRSRCLLASTPTAPPADRLRTSTTREGSRRTQARETLAGPAPRSAPPRRGRTRKLRRPVHACASSTKIWRSPRHGADQA